MIPVVLAWSGTAGLFAASLPVWTAVFALALLSTAFAYILYFSLIGSAGATNASLVTLIVPVSAILLGFLFLGERLELFEVVGMALIALGLVTIDGRLFRRRVEHRHALATFFPQTARPRLPSEFRRLRRFRQVEFFTIASHCSTFSACLLHQVP